MKTNAPKQKSTKSLHQSCINIKSKPQKQVLHKAKPSRKFGDDLTNMIFPSIQASQRSTKKEMFTHQNSLDQLSSYYSDIEDYLLEEDSSFYSRLDESMKIAPSIDITSEMRKILIRWIIDVVNKFKCCEETLHLTIQLIDICLVENGLQFDRKNFQLLGVASLFIGCKYNEIQVLGAQKFLYICDGIYSLENLLSMESLILRTINFNLNIPTIHNFLQRELQTYNIGGSCQKFVLSFGKVCLLDFNLMNNYKKCQLSSMLVYFGLKIFNFGVQRQSFLEEKHGKKKIKNGILSMMKLYEEYRGLCE